MVNKVRNVSFAVCIVAGLAVSFISRVENPGVEISNGIINAQLYLPDNQKGYYQGTRFDWSGVIPSLEYGGHSYFGQWFEKYSPTLHDAIMGPVEAFSPIGYNEAKAGGDFLMIGIGMIRKPEEAKYSFANPYHIVNNGKWKVKKKASKVLFEQELRDSQYAYQYKKTVELLKGKPIMVLSHTLKNTGKRTIETDVYNHNFLVMDKETVGKDFVVKLPFPLSGEARPPAGFGKLEDNKIIFLKDFTKNDHLQYLSLGGYSNIAKDYDIRVENHKTGAAVRITSDQPFSRLAFWSAYATICPEPYIKIKAAPGEVVNWKIFYEFYNGEKNK